jgi:hypothetical protein
MIQSSGILNGFVIQCFISKISAISQVSWGETETFFNDQIWENCAWNEIPRNRNYKTLNQNVSALEMIQSFGILNGFLIQCFISKISAISQVSWGKDLLTKIPCLMRQHAWLFVACGSDFCARNNQKAYGPTVVTVCWIMADTELTQESTTEVRIHFTNPCSGLIWAGNCFRSSIKQDTVFQHPVPIKSG